MFPAIGIVLVLVTIFQNHIHLAQAQYSSLQAWPPMGFVSRTSINGDRTALSSINNAKVGVSHNERYPYARPPLWIPPYAARPLGFLPRPLPIGPAAPRPFYPITNSLPLGPRPYPQRPYTGPIPSGIGGRNKGGLLGGLNVGGLLGGLLG